MIETEFKIEGLSCGHCVSAVERMMRETNGVQSATVSLPDKAKIMFDESIVSVEELKKVINDSEIYKVT